MKILTAILLSVVLFSCGMSKSEKSKIETMIQLHNTVVNTRFVMDSIKESTRKEISINHLRKDIDIPYHLKVNGDVYKSNWNIPYQISNDYNLTFDKYLEYCKANNKDPKTFYKFMN